MALGGRKIYNFDVTSLADDEAVKVIEVVGAVEVFEAAEVLRPGKSQLGNSEQA
jgi:hypothetical protein